MRGVHHIGPLAGRVHAEFAVAACAVNATLNHHGGRTVHIGDEQLTGHRLGGIGFCQGSGVDTANGGQIVGTQDGDRHHLLGAVSRCGVKAVRIRLTVNKFIMGRTHGVSPLAGGIDAELAVSVVAVDRLRHECICAVYVTHRQLTAGSQRDIGFLQTAGADTGDHSCIVGAGDVDSDLAAGRAVHTGDGDGVADFLVGT